MRIHQFVPYLHTPGDAAADQVYAFRQAFSSRGYETDIYALEGDPEVADLWCPATQYAPDPGAADDVLLYHYGIGSSMTELVKSAPGQLILYYHNITPARFVAPFHPKLADSLQAGREELRTLREVPAIAPSEYSRRELMALDFRQVSVVPLMLNLDRLHSSAETGAGRELVERYADGAVNWVTVGRVAPNKRCEDALKAFAYYHRMINPHSRLFYVGGYRHFEAYQFNLARLAERLDVADSVHWCGWVSYEDGFGAYYQLASVFVYMSEHEGFCMPVLEAMSFDVPVIAYAAAAIPSTMGTGGALLRRKSYEITASLVDLIQNDESLRGQLVASQRRRVAQSSTEEVRETLIRTVAEYSGLGPSTAGGGCEADDVC